MLSDAGLVTGRPVPTLEGELVLDDTAMVLLERVAGHELEGDTEQEQRAPSPPIGSRRLGRGTAWACPLRRGLSGHVPGRR